MKKIELAYIIDDDEIIIYLTNKLIMKSDFCQSIETFTEAERALERLTLAAQTGENIPDVILFDLNMPQMNGWEFIEAFKKINFGKEVPTFIFTSSIDPNDKQRSFQYTEIKDFITKPLTLQKLDKILRLIDA
jgi:CheY-like chemotaxis protein